jgi:hypothetical protein
VFQGLLRQFRGLDVGDGRVEKDESDISYAGLRKTVDVIDSARGEGGMHDLGARTLVDRDPRRFVQGLGAEAHHESKERRDAFGAEEGEMPGGKKDLGMNQRGGHVDEHDARGKVEGIALPRHDHHSPDRLARVGHFAIVERVCFGPTPH